MPSCKSQSQDLSSVSVSCHLAKVGDKSLSSSSSSSSSLQTVATRNQEAAVVLWQGEGEACFPFFHSAQVVFPPALKLVTDLSGSVELHLHGKVFKRRQLRSETSRRSASWHQLRVFPQTVNRGVTQCSLSNPSKICQTLNVV